VIDNSRPHATAYSLTDGGGLYVEVLPSGSKVWRYKYHRLGKREKITIGPYPSIGIKAACDLHEVSSGPFGVSGKNRSFLDRTPNRRTRTLVSVEAQTDSRGNELLHPRPRLPRAVVVLHPTGTRQWLSKINIAQQTRHPARNTARRQ
jgi:hypothetical protein